MEEGKVPWDVLKQLLHKQGYSNPGIILGPGLGLDATVIDFEQAAAHAQAFYQTSSTCYLILKTDPITFPTPNPARYAVRVCANDIVTTGAIPYGFGATVIFPPGCSKAQVLALQDEMDRQCKELAISILGGHTEISSSVTGPHPIVAGTMVGFVPSEYYVKREIHTRNKIIISGTCGMEGTSILAREGRDKLSGLMSNRDLKTAAGYVNHLSIINRALTVNKTIRPGLIHDATEGGILGALYEAIAPTGFGAQISKDRIPVSEVTVKISELMHIDPLKLISSGTMVLIVAEDRADECIQILKRSLPVEIVGEVKDKGYGLKLDRATLDPPGPDHIIQGLRNLEQL
ncbi:MAG: AIR synthase-related protein [Candidatus Heimdallarchaeota archaeon]